MPGLSKRICPGPGSYLLVLYLRRRTTIQVGQLGSCSFPRGWYFYAGSAFGPGGLKARLSHHLKPVNRYHWHIDYLRSCAELRMLWYVQAVNNEHHWSAALHNLPGGSYPLPGFGSSDCRCPSHLVHFSSRQSQRLLRTTLGGEQLKLVLLK
ncbi:Uri superfamily endonuclease [Malonomonas rubra DSM 5091]|uniref:Uri superfamily endonuclease n=1 Tax=Malonomonas rubra DSM 5091 TaxID=1122189 RepID=A0A1M6JA65_MALRU|nr:GIY-YIG nuclease family protein [Malonomonas rubra]SHJ43524.1 Uri superfamily endonuclease [Malonomonas rubra DSM 5091]